MGGTVAPSADGVVTRPPVPAPGEATPTMTDDENEQLNIFDLFLPVQERGLRRLPRLLRGAIRLVWAAAPREFAISAALQVIGAVVVAGQVLVGREVLANVLDLGGERSFGDVLPWLVALSALTAVASFATLGRTEQQRLLSELVSRRATDQVLEVATAVDLLAFDSASFHNRLQRARINAANRPTMMANGLLGILSAVITIGGIAGALLFLEPLFVVFVLLAYVPMWVATARSSRVAYRFSVEQTERDRMRDYLTFLLTRKEEAPEIRVFGLGDMLRERYRWLYDQRIIEMRRLTRRRMKLGLIGGFATSALTGATIALLVWFVTSGRLDLAEAGAAAGAIVLLAQRLQTLATSSGSLYESSLFIEDFTTFVEAMPAIERSRSTTVPPEGFTELTVENVSFCYPSRRTPAVDSVSMRVGQGQVVALVGENGSGKTTLAKMLAGLYTPTGGAIRWDGVDISTYDPALVQASVGVIFQDFAKYHLSARENVVFGRYARQDEEALVEAARRSGAHSFLESLPAGYETVLGPEFFGGSDLSVGQWQRVALARAFFRDAPFLILDEPSAALDPRSEAELFERIRGLYRGRTVLLISHRFSSVRTADYIYVLNGGRMVEEGTHDDLMRQNGLYAELFTLQADAFTSSTADTPGS